MFNLKFIYIYIYIISLIIIRQPNTPYTVVVVHHFYLCSLNIYIYIPLNISNIKEVCVILLLCLL